LQKDTKDPNIEKLPFRDRKQKIPVDRMMPEQPGAPYPKVKLGNKIWFFLKGKKRAIGIVSFTIGELWGGTIGLVFKAIGAIFGFTGIADPVARKLNEKTSGEKINWRELIEQLWNFIKSIFTKGG